MDKFDRQAIQAAQRKRRRRVERNIRNEAAQGNYPEGLLPLGSGWEAKCRCCDEWYEIGCDASEFNPDMSYCGSQWCLP